jgi:CheY-like chemotaxis protein
MVVTRWVIASIALQKLQMKKRVLLIDDEQVFHLINTKVIEHAGVDCEIETAANGSEAQGIINKYLTGNTSIPDVIFIDLNMPVMDGFQFIRAFKSMEFPHKDKVTLVILTSSVNEKDRMHAKTLGIDHYIAKPLTQSDLKNILDEHYE